MVGSNFYLHAILRDYYLRVLDAVSGVKILLVDRETLRLLSAVLRYERCEEEEEEEEAAAGAKQRRHLCRPRPRPCRGLGLARVSRFDHPLGPPWTFYLRTLTFDFPFPPMQPVRDPTARGVPHASPRGRPDDPALDVPLARRG